MLYHVHMKRLFQIVLVSVLSAFGFTKTVLAHGGHEQMNNFFHVVFHFGGYKTIGIIVVFIGLFLILSSKTSQSSYK